MLPSSFASTFAGSLELRWARMQFLATEGLRGRFLEEFAINGGCLAVKADKEYILDLSGVLQHFFEGNVSGSLFGKPVATGADGGKSDASGAQVIRNFQRTPVARPEHLIFVVIAVLPHRACGVDHMPGR